LPKDAHLLLKDDRVLPAGKNKMFAGLAGEEVKQSSSYNCVQTFMKGLCTVMKKLDWRNKQDKKRK